MPLTFFPEPNESEQKIRERARNFARQEIAPRLATDDLKAIFRKEIFREAARQKLTALAIPKEWGGGNESYSCHFAVLEEIARVAAAYSVTIGVTNLIQGAILHFGSLDQKTRYLPLLTSGEWLGAFSLSESNAGSDAASLRLAAIKKGNSYLLNGTKMWCSNGGSADLYLVMARTGEAGAKGISAFLVEATTPGFRIGKQEKKLGLRTSTLTELIFEDCTVSASQLIGGEGQGFKVALSQLDTGRIGIGVCGVGLACDSLETYYTTKAIREAIREDRFARYYAELQAIKSLISSVASLKDAGKRVTVGAAQIKLLGSDIAMRVTSDALEALSPDSVRVGFSIERHFRDAKALQIVEGTNQIQCLVLTKHLEGIANETPLSVART